MRAKTLVVATTLVLVTLNLGIDVKPDAAISAEQVAGRVDMGDYEPVVPWPKPLPDHWQIGPVTGVFVDTHDQIWINSQSDKLTKYDLALRDGNGDCCNPSPRVMVFDLAGNVVKSWGGPGDGFEWPNAPHAIYVDHKENVWITANGTGDTHVWSWSITKDSLSWTPPHRLPR